MAVKFNNDALQEAIQKGGTVVVDFWAEWCGPCRMVSPIIEELSAEYDGKAIIGKVNVDEVPEAAQQYGIRNIPTVLIFKDGEVADKITGAVAKGVFQEKINGVLN